MAEEHDQGAPAKMRMISFFDYHHTERKELLQRVIDGYIKDKPKPELQADFSNHCHCYKIREAFTKADSYWIKKVRRERFKTTFSRGILYRPTIVDEMMQLINASFTSAYFAKGISIKGPEGIGKSHSMVNLVRKLLYATNGKYLVTFIPDCEKWTGIGSLFDAVCGSIGCTRSDLGICDLGKGEDWSRFTDLVKVVDSIIAKYDMKWVFIFDQIDRLMTRPENDYTNDIRSLPIPFCAIKSVMKLGRITPIVSASVDNSILPRDRHPSFEDYNHCYRMSITEINSVFHEVTNLGEDERNLVYMETGCIPLKVEELISFEFSIEKYQEHELELVLTSLEELEEKTDAMDFDEIASSAMACLLQFRQQGRKYDRKYSIRSNRGDQYYIMPLFPTVLVAYRAFFWDSVLSTVKWVERDMLQACQNRTLTNDTCNQFLELIVMNQCSTNANVTLNIDWDFPRLLNCTLIKTFASQALPNDMDENGMYVPLYSNFPAIDLIWKCDRRVCGVKVHVAIHNGTDEVFEKLCTDAGWFDQFDKVFMLYLSPTKEVASEMQRELSFQQQSRIHVAAASIHDVSCLNRIVWPEVNLT